MVRAIISWQIAIAQDVIGLPERQSQRTLVPPSCASLSCFRRLSRGYYLVGMTVAVGLACVLAQISRGCLERAGVLSHSGRYHDNNERTANRVVSPVTWSWSADRRKTFPLRSGLAHRKLTGPQDLRGSVFRYNFETTEKREFCRFSV